MFKSLEQSFKTLKQCAHNHALKLSEQKALDSAYKELVPQQYRSVLNRVKKKVPCKGKNQTCYCGGAAEIILEMQARRFMFFIIYIIQKKKKKLAMFDIDNKRSLKNIGLFLFEMVHW